jgi:hypothetical protein
MRPHPWQFPAKCAGGKGGTGRQNAAAVLSAPKWLARDPGEVPSKPILGRISWLASKIGGFKAH